MGIGLRVYLLKGDDSLNRLPLSRYERLLRGVPKESLPEYAEKRVRYASVVVGLLNRKPREIIHIQYSYLFFDTDGRLDFAELDREARLAVDVLPPLLMAHRRGQVIPAKHRFAKKRFDDRYRWTPSPKVEAEIVKAVFGKARN